MIAPTTAAAGLALLAAVAQAPLARAAPAQAAPARIIPAVAAPPGPRYVSLPIELSPVLAQAPRPAVSEEPAKRAAEGTAKLRAAAETTGSLKPAPEKPWCPAGRRVGTGAGFCLIN